jgi:hypothetical protein
VEIWRDGTSLIVRDKPQDLQIDPLPDTPHWRFWWFNNDFNRHHLADWWAWYAAVAGFATQTTRLWIGGYGAVSGAILLAGLALGWRALPPGLFSRPPRRRKRRHARPRPATPALTAAPRRAETEP